MTTIIYHNPRCSKSRQTLQLLQEKGIEAEVVDYLKTGLTRQEIEALLDKLGIAPEALIRTKEAEYKEAGLDKPGVSGDDMIAAMVRYPKLFERPVVVHGDKAAIGRPPEQVLTLFG